LEKVKRCQWETERVLLKLWLPQETSFLGKKMPAARKTRIQ